MLLKILKFLLGNPCLLQSGVNPWYICIYQVTCKKLNFFSKGDAAKFFKILIR